MPPAAPRAEGPHAVDLQIVSPCAAKGDGSLQEVKHDGHRLIAISAGDGVKSS